MKHAYVKLESDGAVSIRWWVDADEGVAARKMIQLRPGERAFDLGFAEWRARAGTFVDLDEVQSDGWSGPDRN